MYSDSTSAQCSLAARKLISVLSKRPDELLRYLNRESSIFSKASDPSVLAALRILRLFYEQVKSEISQASDKDAAESTVLRFLQLEDRETCRSVVSKYAKNLSPRNWKEIEINEKLPKRKVPESVPRLPQNFDDYAESEESFSSISENNKSKSNQIIEVVGSSSSSSVLDYVPDSLSKRRSSRLSKVGVDKSCSPIEADLFDLKLAGPPKAASSRKLSSRTENEPISVTSMGVQTDAIKIDVSTRTYFNNSSSLTSTDKTSKTSSSIISSEHSVGQISHQRAEFLTSKSNFRIVTIRRDGSIQPTFNYSLPLDHSTPIRPPIVQDPQIDRSISHFRMGSSSESPLIAQEQSIHSISENDVPQPKSQTVEDLAPESEEDVSTLNQISPLPTG